VERLVAEANVDLVVLDDAFQHRRIQRDLELLVIDGLRLPTQDWLLPLGRLREPRRSLRRADLLLVNKLYDPSALPKVRQALAGYQRPLVLARPVAEALYHWQNQPPQPLAVLKGQAVILLAGIGNPDAFRQQVEALGADVVGTHFYRDHHAYRPADFRRLRAALTQHPKAWVILTEKDQARLLDASWAVDFADLPLYALRISLAYWEGEAALTQALARVVSLTQASA
jgi:tetraacyldisaccharide 4'-kinase